MKINQQFEGSYEVARDVYIKKQKTNYKIFNNGILISFNRNKWVIIKPSINKGGYEQVSLRIGKKKYNRLIHRLVGIHFIENPKKLPQINHLDGVKTNNEISNLEWCNASRNGKHAFDLKLSSVFTRKSGAIPKRVGKYFANILLKTYPAIGHVVKDGYSRTSVTRHVQKESCYQGFYWKIIE